MKKLVAIALILLGVGVICAYFVFDKSDVIKLKGDPYSEEKTIAAAAINSIYVETDTYNVTFVKGTTDDIQLRLDGSVSKKNKKNIIFDANTKGDALYIKSHTKNQFMVGISIVNLKLVVELPDKLWDTVKVETDTGNINIDQFKADKLSVDSDTGNLKISNYSVNTIDFDTDTGNVTLTDGTGKIKGDTDTGNIKIETEELQNDVTLQSDTGNISINVDKNPESAAIRIEKELGNSKIEWSGFSDTNQSNSIMEGKIGSGDISIAIKTDVGSVKLGNR